MAARFKFRLQGLLKLRHSLEEEAQRNLARTIALQQEAQTKLNDLRTAHAGTVDGRRLVTNQVIDLEAWRATERYLLVLESRILWATEELTTAQTQVNAARAALLKAHQDHRMLERLKERRVEQHAQELLRVEAQEMDEIAVLRYRISHAGAPPANTETA